MRSGIWLLAACLAAAGQSPTDVFARAAAALSGGDYATAEAGFQKVLQTAPDHVDSLLNLGVVYSRTGRAELAATTYQRVLSLTPGNPVALLNLGLAQMRRMAFAEALSAFQTLIETEPDNASMRNVQLLFPLTDGYLRENDSASHRAKLDAFLARVTPAAANLVLCKMYGARDRMEDAERHCRRALQLDPQFSGAHLELARVLVSRHSPQADGELTTAIREKPTDPEALYDLGVALLQAGRTNEALPLLERSRSLNPRFWGSYYQLGKIRLQMRQPERAVELLRKAAELNDTSFSLYYELGRGLQAMGRTEGAKQAMARARELMAADLERERHQLRNK